MDDIIDLEMVDPGFASWNRLAGWLSLIGAVRAGTRIVKGTIMG